MTGGKYHIHKDMVLQCSKLLHSKVSSGFLRQDLKSSYSFAKIQNVGGAELSEEKYCVSLDKVCIHGGAAYWLK